MFQKLFNFFQKFIKIYLGTSIFYLREIGANYIQLIVNLIIYQVIKITISREFFGFKFVKILMIQSKVYRNFGGKTIRFTWIEFLARVM